MTELGSLIRDIRTLVECESPSEDRRALARSADTVARLGRAAFAVEPDRIVVDNTPHLRWRFGSGRRRILLLAHHDTVWPVGTLANRPFTADDSVVRGPGAFDMKAGLAMGIHALAELGEEERDGITLLVTGDEEVGSPSSRALIEAEARGLDAALVLEPSGEGGALKIARKGMSTYRVDISGRAAHAGLDPDNGINAGLELAHRILSTAALGDRELGTTVTPTAATAGSTINTVPASARLVIDVRAWTRAEQLRVDSALRAMPTTVADAAAGITGGVNRPPMEESMTLGLFARAQAVAARLGLGPLTCSRVGGASDGNFTAGMGIPTLDGLGAVGGGAHADDEHVRTDHLLPRVALLRGLLHDLHDQRAS